MSSVIWKCPICKERIEAIATVVTHHCPDNNNALTQWEKVNNK